MGTQGVLGARVDVLDCGCYYLLLLLNSEYSTRYCVIPQIRSIVLFFSGVSAQGRGRAPETAAKSFFKKLEWGLSAHALLSLKPRQSPHLSPGVL